MIKKIILGLGVAMAPLWAVSLEHKIGQMLMVGFHGTSAPADSQICKDIKKYNAKSDSKIHK
jgi:beta-N-acetylhexosaminidase